MSVRPRRSSTLADGDEIGRSDLADLALLDEHVAARAQRVARAVEDRGVPEQHLHRASFARVRPRHAPF